LLLVLVLVLACFTQVFASTLCVPGPNDVAVNVFGQTTVNFTAALSGAGLNQLNSPYDVKVDPSSGKIFILDTFNNRMLRFPNSAAFKNGASAEATFGGTFSTPGCTATLMNEPGALWISPDGICYVADSVNSRVLRFTSCGTLASGAPADGVFGQNSMTNCSGQDVSIPYGITGDASGNLWVANFIGALVQKYANAATAQIGAQPVVLLGGQNLALPKGCTSDAMTEPKNLAYDSTSNTLWVADFICNRVLAFKNANTKVTGDSADYVLGQASILTMLPTCLSAGLSAPWGLWFDAGTSALFVADYANQRVLVFDNAGSLQTAASANSVIGQPDLTTCTGGNDPNTMILPYGIYYDTTLNLMVADFVHNRVLRYQCPTSPSSSKAAGTSPSQTGTGTKNPILSGVELTQSNTKAGATPSHTKAGAISNSPTNGGVLARLACQALCNGEFQVCKRTGVPTRLCRLQKKGCVHDCPAN